MPEVKEQSSDACRAPQLVTGAPAHEHILITGAACLWERTSWRWLLCLQHVSQTKIWIRSVSVRCCSLEECTGDKALLLMQLIFSWLQCSVRLQEGSHQNSPEPDGITVVFSLQDRLNHHRDPFML